MASPVKLNDTSLQNGRGSATPEVLKLADPYACSVCKYETQL